MVVIVESVAFLPMEKKNLGVGWRIMTRRLCATFGRQGATMEMGASFPMVQKFSMPRQLGEQEAQQEEAQEAEEAQEGKTTRRRRIAEAQSEGGSK